MGHTHWVTCTLCSGRDRLRLQTSAPWMGRRSLLCPTHAGQQSHAGTWLFPFYSTAMDAARPTLIPSGAERLQCPFLILGGGLLCALCAQASGARHVSGFAVCTPVRMCSFSRAPFSHRSLDKRDPEPTGQDWEPPLPWEGLTNGLQALASFLRKVLLKHKESARGRAPEAGRQRSRPWQQQL